MIASAQMINKSYEAIGKYNKKISGSCVAIKVSTDLKNAQSLMEALLKKEGLKGKKQGKTLNYKTIIYQTISPDYMNLNIAFEKTNKSKKNSVTTVYCFLSKGKFGESEFVSAVSDPQEIANLKNLLDTKYAEAIYNYDIALHEKAKKKNIDKRTKDIKGYEKDIDKAKENIETAKRDIETAQKAVEDKIVPSKKK
jgi:predicted  nucleic acid-binding Zn-ribbon protein